MSDRNAPSGSRRILVTGGAGFIGAALCRHLARQDGRRVINVDRLTYAANPAALASIEDHPAYRFERLDIADEAAILALLHEEQVEAIVHLAAETHVDRSIAEPRAFLDTNVMGTFRLLEAALSYWRSLPLDAQERFRFHLVSTDEVFGDVPYDDPGFTSATEYRPSSPYAASKAAAEHLVQAWHRTYGLPVLISNSSNNYGPWQRSDKLIPLSIACALEERPIPLYGTGANVRDWLFVDDHVEALVRILNRGRPGQSYHVAERGVRTNLEVVQAICRLLDARRPRAAGRPHEELITFVPDRPGHDRRYAVDPRKTEAELGWTPRETFETGLRKTVDWYLDATSGRHRDEPDFGIDSGSPSALAREG